MSYLFKKLLVVSSVSALFMLNAQAKEVNLTDNVYFITEKLIVPQGSTQQWQWSSFESLPDEGISNEKATKQYSENKNQYYLSREIVGNKYIALKGTRKGPEVIFFNSGYGEGDELWKLSQIVNTANVKKLQSNCTLKNITVGGGESSGDSGETLDYQNFYKWQRAGSQPLYIAESKGDGYVLTSVFNSYNWKNYTVVRDPKLFNKYGVWNTDKNGKELTCNFK